MPAAADSKAKIAKGLNIVAVISGVVMGIVFIIIIIAVLLSKGHVFV